MRKVRGRIRGLSRFRGQGPSESELKEVCEAEIKDMCNEIIDKAQSIQVKVDDTLASSDELDSHAITLDGINYQLDKVRNSI